MERRFNYKKNKNIVILPGSKIEVNEKPLNETSVISQRFQQVGSIITSLVTLAILANIHQLIDEENSVSIFLYHVKI